MTIGELIRELSKYTREMEVVIMSDCACDDRDDFQNDGKPNLGSVDAVIQRDDDICLYTEFSRKGE